MGERVGINPNTVVMPKRGDRIFPWRAMWLGLALSLIGVGHVKPQITTISQGSQLPSPQVVGSMPDPNGGPRETDPALDQQRIQEMKIERHAEIVSDANKLLKLTARLNSEIEQSHANSLNPKQLRTLAKIEKLARNVKQTMSTPIQ
jgi:hypothetical protein